MGDTAPEIAALARRWLLARPGVERLVMGCQMFEVARTLVLASLPPGLPDLEIKIRLCERVYGNEVDVASFGHRLSRQ